MSLFQKILSVLDQDKEVKHKDYDDLLKGLSRNPNLLSDIVSNSIRESLIAFLVTRSERFISFVYRVSTAPPSIIAESSTKRLAEHLGDAFVKILPDLCRVLDDSVIAELLTPVLTLCVDRRLPCLQKLATSLGSMTKVLQILSVGESSGAIIRTWSITASLIPGNDSTLEAWTTTLVCLADSCPPDYHNVKHQIQRFKSISAVSNSLMQCVREAEMKDGLPATQLPNIAGMRPLRRDDKKNSHSKVTSHQERSLNFREDLQTSLQELELELPQSSRGLRHVIETLRFERTREVLIAVGGTFPCKRCNNTLAIGIVPNLLSEEISLKDSSPPKTDSELFGKQVGTWKVLLSQTALKGLQGMDQTGSVRSKLVDLSKMCANSERAGSSQLRKRLRVRLWQIRCKKDLKILWQVDLGFNSMTRLWQQEVKVWDIGDENQIAKTINQVVSLHQSYTDEKIDRCKQQGSSLKNSLPLSFPTTDSRITESSDENTLMDVNILDQETIELANKFYALTEPVLRSVIARDISAQFPLDISAEEENIIRHSQSSSLILGRSGTGKTTCLVYKLVAKFLASKSTETQPVRQVLMTRSSHLAQKLKSYTTQLIKTIYMRSDQDQVKGSTGETEQTAAESAISLDDQSFPLICTFDRFLQILENTVSAMNRHNFEPNQQSWNVVSYDSFRLDYWPHFPSQLTKKLSVSLVFSEIMGVIKGSASSSKSLKHSSREAYLARSEKRSSTIPSRTRTDIYCLFEHYEAFKVQRGEQDYVDRVIKILAAVRGSDDLRRLLGSTFNELYIDEVQDHRTIDIELFLSFINDTRGFHFAGDTAQAIAQDSSFRFGEISALIFNHFATTRNALNLAKPTLFKLATNYRSHQRILSLASLVMDLIWNGYPETVDKLSPEVGQVFGPMPTLFLGCGPEILTTSNAGKVKLSENTAEFGAEQVILVRDDFMKTKLQNSIGDAALVLTIIQSKGMEFDDVILLDFFSQCPHASGLRKIKDLLSPKTASAFAYDYPDMCSELKSLYVAITRARIQLFLIESSDKLTLPVRDLFRNNGKKSMVDVTNSSDASFAEKLLCLRPGQSVDPRRWSLRGEQFMQSSNFKDALFCYRKGNNEKGVMEAQAEINAENARICRASGDTQGCLKATQDAKELFLRLNLVDKVSMLFQAMDKLADAANLWVEYSNFGKAADLFKQASLWEEAASCFEKDGRFEEAATMLRRGSKFDALVVFLSNSHGRMETDSYLRFTRFCKILLKQGKISVGKRKQAISLLGSLAEQETYLREYEMHEERLEWLEIQDRHADVYLLKIQLGKLEAALETALKQKLASTAPALTDQKLIHLIDYVMTERAINHLTKKRNSEFKVPEASKVTLTDRVTARLAKWKIARGLLPWMPSTRALQDFESLEQDDMKIIVSLLNLCYSDITANCSVTADLPYNILNTAIHLVSHIAVTEDSIPRKTLMTVCGIRCAPLFGEEEGSYLQWSPLVGKGVNGKSHSIRPELFVCTKLSSAVISFESKAVAFRRASIKVHCYKFLAQDFCTAQAEKRCDSRRQHKRISSSECTQNISDLHEAVNMICGMTKLYYQRVMPEQFQKAFLPMKRRWLETLILQLTYVSALEQDFSAIGRRRADIAKGNVPTATTAALEDLLFHRQRAEWEKRRAFSKLLEDAQLAELLGRNVETRFHLALSYRIVSTSDIRRTSLSRLLKQSARSGNLENFGNLLAEFMDVLLKTETIHMGPLYSIVTELESLATFLILKVSSQVSLVPYSWLVANASWLVDSDAATKPTIWAQQNVYFQYLFSFARNISKFFIQLLKSPIYGVPDLLRQRNAELLAFVWINLIAVRPSPLGMKEAWDDTTKTFFQAYYCNAIDYNKELKKPVDLHRKLQISFSRYNGKDELVLFSKVPKPNHHFGIFANAKTMTPKELSAYSPSKVLVATSSTDSDKYSVREMEAIIKIQHFWRSWVSRFMHHQKHMQTPEAKVIAKFIALGSHVSTSFPMRATLVSKGPHVFERWASIKTLFTPLRRNLMERIETINDSDDQHDTLGDALSRCTSIEEDFVKISILVSEENLKALVKDGVLSKLMHTFSDVSQIIQAAETKIISVQKDLAQCAAK